MTDDTNNSPPRTRRSSFAGQTFADIFGSGRSSVTRSNDNSNSPPSSYPGPITTAAAQAQRRRLSLTTLGLNSTNTQSSSFSSGGFRGRNDSLGSANESIDECAVEDDQNLKDGPTPATPFARRVSFGARAMMDIKNNGQSPNQNGRSSPASASNGGGGSAGVTTSTRAPSVGTISSRDVKGRVSGEGFNWSDNFRTRAERSSNAGLPTAGGIGAIHQRAKSVAVMEPPIREPPREQKRPDHFQERILKGDFYMD